MSSRSPKESVLSKQPGGSRSGPDTQGQGMWPQITALRVIAGMGPGEWPGQKMDGCKDPHLQPLNSGYWLLSFL